MTDIATVTIEPVRQQMEKAAQDVLAERERQKSVEGWTLDHDDAHDDGELALAAACYALPEYQRYIDIRRPGGAVFVALVKRLWPWADEWWKPKDVRSDLVKAGALIIAEIERLDRLPPANGEGR